MAFKHNEVKYLVMMMIAILYVIVVVRKQTDKPLLKHFDVHRKLFTVLLALCKAICDYSKVYQIICHLY